jgi:hypothetical protein
MTPGGKTALKASAAGLAVLLVAAAFAAHLHPGMLIEFANVVLCF